MNGLKPDMVIVDEPMEGIDYAVMEQMIAGKLDTKSGTFVDMGNFGVGIGHPIATEPFSDRYQERAKKDGITREEAKSKMFSEDYGSGDTGVKDWKKDLRKLIVKNG